MSLAILRDNSIQKLDTYTDSDRSSRRSRHKVPYLEYYDSNSKGRLYFAVDIRCK